MREAVKLQGSDRRHFPGGLGAGVGGGLEVPLVIFNSSGSSPSLLCCSLTILKAKLC